MPESSKVRTIRRLPTRASAFMLCLCALAGGWLPAEGLAQQPIVVIGVPNWPSARATANIIKVVLEDRLQTPVELKEMASPDIFAGMDDGEVQIHPEAWLPNYAELTAEYVDRRGTVRQSAHQVAAAQNICTTREAADELGVHSLADLADPAKAAFFDTDGDGRGEMWIGEESWTSTSIEKIRARSYGYDRTMELLEAPEEVALATIDASIAVKKPVVFYCYTPHYLFRLHDIIALEEPAYDAGKWRIVLPDQHADWLEQSDAAVAWPPSHFQIDYATALEHDRPDVATFLKAIVFDPETVEEMSYALVVKREDPHDFAASWVATHADVVDKWVAGQ